MCSWFACFKCDDIQAYTSQVSVPVASLFFAHCEQHMNRTGIAFSFHCIKLLLQAKKFRICSSRRSCGIHHVSAKFQSHCRKLHFSGNENCESNCRQIFAKSALLAVAEVATAKAMVLIAAFLKSTAANNSKDRLDRLTIFCRHCPLSMESRDALVSCR